MKKNTNCMQTIYACFIGYIVQAIVNNFVPLLFVTFQNNYHISLERITFLITLNFIIQLFVDLLSAFFIDRIGYRISILIAHILSAAGLILLTVLPEVFSSPYTGLVIAVIIYAIGGGLLEVLVSPIIEACPTDNKEKAMSLLHSFYCWGMWALFCYQPHFSGFSEYRTGKSSHLCGLSSQYLTLSSSEVHQSTPFTKKVNRDFLSENCAHLKSSGC